MSGSLQITYSLTDNAVYWNADYQVLWVEREPMGYLYM